MPAMPKDDEIKNAYLAFRQWEKEHKVKFIATEQLVYSKKYNFVGTLDCIAEVDGEYCLIDFKSSNGIYWDMILQVSGYGIAHEEETKKKFDRAWIVRFGKDDAEFTAKDFNISQKLNKGFLSCLYLKKIQKEVVSLTK
jgi:ATP-dependent exoDNAse (exonuclease V) beta subunit